MSQKYQEYKGLNLPNVAQTVLEKWEKEKVFEKSISTRDEDKQYVFFEGPPSANGLPGIHHVMARSIKDIFCRYKTLKGFQVKRKAGWDTHGLPVELGVEKELGITKEDIGSKITVDDYNKACKEAVMRYTDIWNDLTHKMGYWVDMEDPYITYEPKYMESVWWLLGQLYEKNLIYKGYTIQPYSPKAGTGLSSHELNQPGCYRDVKDTTVVAQFKIKPIERELAINIDELHDEAQNTLHKIPLVGIENVIYDLQEEINEDIYFLAWTTTPWTLPSNTALCVGQNIEYVLVKMPNHLGIIVNVILAKDRLWANYNWKQVLVKLKDYQIDPDKTSVIDAYNKITKEKIENNINTFDAFKLIINLGLIEDVEIIYENILGSHLVGIKYEQLLPYALPAETPEKAFHVISGDFVTTNDGTGIVHIAPTFGADDARVAHEAGVPAMLVPKLETKESFIERWSNRYIDIPILSAETFTNIYSSSIDFNERLNELINSKYENLVLDIKTSLNNLKTKNINDTIDLLKNIDKNEILDLIGHEWELARKGNLVPLVDLTGRFRTEVKDEVFGLSQEYVKADYLTDEEKATELGIQKEKLKSIIPDLKAYMSVDERIALKLKIENKAFKIEKYEHSYPHCWRTDKSVLYYPLDSWFIRVTDVKERMIELNNTINWKPESTGSGRFGKWLENVNDWNLSRSRYWGIPIPIWSSAEGDERIIISSVEQLKAECEKAVQAGVMDANPLADFVVGDMSKENYAKIDLHKNYVDTITLVSASGKPMKRESDLIDVWFDSGAMPYAQWHYPFENKDLIDNRKGYPGDFIAEGVDQTRGWFYTLHAIATMVFDSVAYKNVVSNGLVLDKNGQKMSKRLGNAVDPFTTLEKYGPDATRWYMITNAQPWDNLKFDLEGITEVQRKFFGTLYNTYSFFTLYANIDGFDYSTPDVAWNERPEIDRWILSKLNSLIKEVDEAFEIYEPTKAGRLIQEFVSDQLSNWYVRLCRRRFWKGDFTTDKISAYQTLYTCLETIAILGSPIAPFFMDQLFSDLNAVTKRHTATSVHLADFPKVNEALINPELENQMNVAQRVSSLVLGIRKKEKIRVRQPLQTIMVPTLSKTFSDNITHVQDLILSEVNVKELHLLEEGSGVIVKSIKANFKTIGPKYGKQMKAIAELVKGFTSEDIATIEKNTGWNGTIDGENIQLDLADFEILAQDIPGWLVSTEGDLTVALDVTISEELRAEGIARELINRVQNLRKESDFEVTDKIQLTVECSPEIQKAIAENQAYVCNEVLATEITFNTLGDKAFVIDLVEEGDAKIELAKQ